jgi:hypothetical protein
MKTIVKTIEVYQTKDDRTFKNKEDAVKHEEWLNSEKIHIILEISYHGSPAIYECYKDIEKALKRSEELNSEATNKYSPIYSVISKAILE